jgi:hypothetical protein
MRATPERTNYTATKLLDTHGMPKEYILEHAMNTTWCLVVEKRFKICDFNNCQN